MGLLRSKDFKSDYELRLRAIERDDFVWLCLKLAFYSQMLPRLTQPRRYSRVSGFFWTASVANCQRNSRMFFGYPSRAIPKQCKFTLLSQPGKHLFSFTHQASHKVPIVIKQDWRLQPQLQPRTTMVFLRDCLSERSPSAVAIPTAAPDTSGGSLSLDC